MPSGTFSFHTNVSVFVAGAEGDKVNIPVDVAIMPLSAKAGDIPLFIEAKSAGDFTNVNKRRKEEAVKMQQLKNTFGDIVSYSLFLCGYFDSGYLGYEAAEGIDWIWEHRISDLEKLGIMIDLERIRERVQFEVDAAKDIEERRKRGQFATPFSLAREIVSYGLDLLSTNGVSFIEPSLGTGAFYSALIQETNGTQKAIKRATGIEIAPAYYDAAKTIWNNNLRIYNADFTHFSPNEKYNLLITNPPYVRHHYISREEKNYLSECVKRETGIEISGLAGLYCYFLLLSHKWLAPGAVCGWLIPREFMDVNYGKSLKEYLLNRVHLLRVHRYDSDNSKFDDALVSSCVVWFKNEIIIMTLNFHTVVHTTHRLKGN